MRLTLRKAAERGHADHGWLDTWHSFSFAEYFDPAHMGFRSLRVINDDVVAPGMGFPTHPHRDMEIFSYVLEGAIAHQDSMGNGRTLRPGEIQLMSAGTGVAHSEANPDRRQRLRLLQVWIQPRVRGLKPSYTEWKPTPAQAAAADVVVISPDGREGSAVIQQDAVVRRLKLRAGEATAHEVAPGRAMWVQVATGALQVGGVAAAQGDGVHTEDAGRVAITATADGEALLFDLG
jgi:redox-sensitive bicupin YhaK (pirin superfamily)